MKFSRVAQAIALGFLLAIGVALADQQTINVGTSPNDGTGDPVRDAFIKVNENFDELYERLESPEGDTIIFQTNVTDWKDSVDIATTASVAHTGEQTIDGVLTSASRVLDKDNSNAALRGIWVTGAGAWSRATDADEDGEFSSGTITFVQNGTTNGDKLFALTTPDPITVGTTSLAYAEISVPVTPEIVKTVTGTSYTLKAGDANKWLQTTSGSAVTITVPTKATANVAVNSVIYVQMYGAGAVSLSAAVGVTIRAPLGLTMSTQYSVGRLKKIAQNEWSFVFLPGASPTLDTIGSTQGHVLYRGASAWSALAVGTSGQALTTQGAAANPVWRFPLEHYVIAASDETTAITATTSKVIWRSPCAFTVTAVRASLSTAQASGSIFTVDIHEGTSGGTTILSTKLTIDNTELTSTTAATPPVISDTSLADDAEMRIDVDQIGDSGAKGLKVMIAGYCS